MSSLFLGFSLAIATFSIKCLDAPEMSSCRLRKEDPDQQVLVRGAPKIVQKQQVEKKAD